MIQTNISKILILDNYDSFTYNLVDYVKEIVGFGVMGNVFECVSVDVFRNDEISLEDIEKYTTIVLSPGAGVPSQAGIMLELIKKYAPTKNILGVCLGHQAIGEAFGATLQNLEKVYHGVESEIQIIDNEDIIFKNINQNNQKENQENNQKIIVGRYHSWVVRPENIPECLKITAIDKNGQIMALRHKIFNVFGVQFHPESIMTPQGKQMMRNFFENTK